MITPGSEYAYRARISITDHKWETRQNKRRSDCWYGGGEHGREITLKRNQK